MHAVSLALALATAIPPGASATLPPAPRQLYRIAWQRPFVEPALLEWRPTEPGGVAVDPGSGIAVFGTRDGWLHAVRPDRTLIWEKKAAAGYAGTPTIEGGTVYAGARDGRLYAIALETGRELWKYDAHEELGTRPVVANGLVYVASLQDTVFAVDAATGAWKWHHRREGRTGFSIRGAADPVVGSRAVYAAYSDGNVVALDRGSGRVLWERFVAPAGDQVDVDGLALAGGKLFAAAYSGAVVALDPDSGNVLWTSRVEGAHALAAAKGLVFVTSPTATLALSTSDGSVVWTAPSPTSAPGTPFVLDGWVLVPCGEEGLRWIEAASGRMFRVLEPGNGVSGAPAAVRSRVYVLSNGGTLYALDLT